MWQNGGENVLSNPKHINVVSAHQSVISENPIGSIQMALPTPYPRVLTCLAEGAISGGATNYTSFFFSSFVSNITTCALFFSASTLSNFRFAVTATNSGAQVTVTLLVNGSASSITKIVNTVSGGGWAYGSDIIDSVTLNDNDYISISISVSAGGVLVTGFSAYLESN